MAILHNSSSADNLSTSDVWIKFMNDSLGETSDRLKVEQIALSTLFVLYTIIGILGNALVLYSIMKIKSWSGLESAMMCFLTNLAISDFCLSLITFPATAISAAANTWVMGIWMCWCVGFAVSYLRIVSILFMMWIGIHRALVIKYPFRKKITKKIARTLSVSVWLLATIPQLTCFAGISPLHYDSERAVCIASMISDNMLPVMIYAFLYLVIPMGTIIGVYSLLLYIAVRAVRRTHTLTELQNNEAPRGRMTVVHRRAFGTVFAQIGGFLLCFLPFVIFVGLSAMDEDIIPTRLQVYGACSSSMSAIINPLIYMNTNKTFKKFVVNLIKCEDYQHKTVGAMNSHAFISQTFRNPNTASADPLRQLRPSRVSVPSQNQIKFEAASTVVARAARIRLRSRSEHTLSPALSPPSPHMCPSREHPNHPGNTCNTAPTRRFLDVNSALPAPPYISCPVPSRYERDTKTVRLALNKSLSDSSLSSRSSVVTPAVAPGRRGRRTRAATSSRDIEKIVLVLDDNGCQGNENGCQGNENGCQGDESGYLDDGNDVVEQDCGIVCSPRISRSLKKRITRASSL